MLKFSASIFGLAIFCATTAEEIRSVAVLQDTVKQAQSKEKIKTVKVLAWADKEYPAVRDRAQFADLRVRGVD